MKPFCLPVDVKDSYLDQMGISFTDDHIVIFLATVELRQSHQFPTILRYIWRSWSFSIVSCLPHLSTKFCEYKSTVYPKLLFWACKMVQLVKTLATMPGYLRPILRAHIVEKGNRFPQVIIWLLHKHHGTQCLLYTHTQCKWFFELDSYYIDLSRIAQTK